MADPGSRTGRAGSNSDVISRGVVASSSAVQRRPFADGGFCLQSGDSPSAFGFLRLAPRAPAIVAARGAMERTLAGFWRSRQGARVSISPRRHTCSRRGARRRLAHRPARTPPRRPAPARVLPFAAPSGGSGDRRAQPRATALYGLASPRRRAPDGSRPSVTIGWRGSRLTARPAGGCCAAESFVGLPGARAWAALPSGLAPAGRKPALRDRLLQPLPALWVRPASLGEPGRSRGAAHPRFRGAVGFWAEQETSHAPFRQIPCPP
jgi:hypothetical protein